MSNIEFIHSWTDDGLRLQGIHWQPNTYKTCVVFIHGMSGNIIENYFVHGLGNILSKNNIGFLYGHNRGYSLRNDIRTNEGNYKRCGATFELFTDSVYDIKLWVDETQSLGYQNIILMGHSLGCNKVIYFMNHYIDSTIKALILASPPNMAEISAKNPFWKEMVKEANNYLVSNQLEHILNYLHNNWLEVCANTFLQFGIKNSPADNIHKLSDIELPIFALMGDHKEVNILTPKEDLLQLKKHAFKSKQFDYLVLKNTNHNYVNQEVYFSEEILKWVMNIEKDFF